MSAYKKSNQPQYSPTSPTNSDNEEEAPNPPPSIPIRSNPSKMKQIIDEKKRKREAEENKNKYIYVMLHNPNKPPSSSLTHYLIRRSDLTDDDLFALECTNDYEYFADENAEDDVAAAKVFNILDMMDDPEYEDWSKNYLFSFKDCWELPDKEYTLTKEMEDRQRMYDEKIASIEGRGIAEQVSLPISKTIESVFIVKIAQRDA